MKKCMCFLALMIACGLVLSCVDNTLDEDPKDDNYPLRLIMDEAEGGDLPQAKDYSVEIKLADHAGVLPNKPIVVAYEIRGVDDALGGDVQIDKVIYTIENDDCVFERPLDFTNNENGRSGAITIAPDDDLGSIPQSFEVVFMLLGAGDAKGGFVFEITGLTTSADVIVGEPRRFTYEVLDHDMAGEWEFSIESKEAFEQFKSVFGPLNTTLAALAYADITGKVTATFEFKEVEIEIELAELEEVVTCEDGEITTEIENMVIGIEAEYDIEDGNLVLEGSHVIESNDDAPEEELDFQVEGRYLLDEAKETLNLIIYSVIDEDHYTDDKMLFKDDEGISFVFERD